MLEKAKGQEIPAAVIAGVIVVALALFVAILWLSGRPEGVKTAKPTPPNPPGGRIVVE